MYIPLWLPHRAVPVHLFARNASRGKRKACDEMSASQPWQPGQALSKLHHREPLIIEELFFNLARVCVYVRVVQQRLFLTDELYFFLIIKINGDLLGGFPEERPFFRELIELIFRVWNF